MLPAAVRSASASTALNFSELNAVLIVLLCTLRGRRQPCNSRYQTGSTPYPDLHRLDRASLTWRRRTASHSAVQPPSTTSAEPVMSAAASDARNTTAPIRSSTWPRRPSLIRLSTSCRKAGSAKNGCVIGVSMKVGQIELTRIRFGARSMAMAFVSPSNACFEAQ
jgi:hypothetical protein